MPETLLIILDYYWRPLKAASRALDHGRIMVAALLALAVSWLASGVSSALRSIQVAQTVADPNHPVKADLTTRALSVFDGSFGTLILVAFVFVPAAIAILAAWKGLGSFGVAMRRDYTLVLVCVLFAWVAARIAGFVLTFVPGIGVWAGVASSGYWLILAICSLSVALGVGLVEAAVASVGALVACAFGFVLYSFVGSSMWFLASPWVLYWGYGLVATDVRLLGSGLRSRQNFRRQLEISTLNPRDADAHYQLGLIYQSRRQNDQAAERFKQAIAIDRGEAGAHYQLGRIALQNGNAKEALDYFCTAAEIDPKHSSNEVWRDMGIALLQLGDRENAEKALARYVERREYDPEGLYWLGKALAASERKAEAVSSFERAIEAAKTAPPHRRGVVRQWIGKSKSELKAIG